MNDRFKEAQRSDVKNWINYRYGRVWAQEGWTFKTGVSTTTLPLSSNTISLSSLGFQRVYGIWDNSYGSYPIDIEALRPEDFYNWTSTSSRSPVEYSVIGGNLVFDAPASSARSITVYGERSWTPLAADGDVPLFPAEFHFALVQGASAEGLRLQNDPTWRDFEDDFQRAIGEMKVGYLSAVRNYTDAYPAWCP